MVTAEEIDNLEFKIIKEDWNEYELKNDIKLRGRVFLTRLVENKNASPPPDLKPNEKSQQLSFSVQKNFQVFAPNHLKGTPTKIPRLDQITHEQKQEIEVLTYNEPWNVYELPKNGAIIKLKLVLNKVWMIKDVFDQFGEPYCVINNQPVFNFEPPNSTDKFA